MDILRDIFCGIPDLETLTRRVETDRSGPFTFRLGLDLPALAVPLVRVQDAHHRFAGSPPAQVSNRLEPEVLASRQVAAQCAALIAPYAGWPGFIKPADNGAI